MVRGSRIEMNALPSPLPLLLLPRPSRDLREAGDELIEDSFVFRRVLGTGPAVVGPRIGLGRDRAVADAHGLEDRVPHGHGFVVGEGGVDWVWRSGLLPERQVVAFVGKLRQRPANQVLGLVRIDRSTLHASRRHTEIHARATEVGVFAIVLTPEKYLTVSIVTEADQGLLRRHSCQGNFPSTQIFIVTGKKNPCTFLGSGLYAFRLTRR